MWNILAVSIVGSAVKSVRDELASLSDADLKMLRMSTYRNCSVVLRGKDLMQGRSSGEFDLRRQETLDGEDGS
jgi:hypothetical protein